MVLMHWSYKIIFNIFIAWLIEFFSHFRHRWAIKPWHWNEAPCCNDMLVRRQRVISTKVLCWSIEIEVLASYLLCTGELLSFILHILLWTGVGCRSALWTIEAAHAGLARHGPRSRTLHGPRSRSGLAHLSHLSHGRVATRHVHVHGHAHRVGPSLGAWSVLAILLAAHLKQTERISQWELH